MTTLLKAKLKTDQIDQTNIDKYRVAANVTEYHIIISQNVTFSRYRKSEKHNT